MPQIRQISILNIQAGLSDLLVGQNKNNSGHLIDYSLLGYFD